MSGPLTEQIERAKLWLANGYQPVPCLRHDAPRRSFATARRSRIARQAAASKAVGRRLAKVYNATPDSIEGWRNLRDIGTYPNTGIACGWAVAADVDVYEAALASRDRGSGARAPGRHAAAPDRAGRPRLLLLYRAATEPLGKAATALFVNDAGQTAQLEIMGQGQQIVAHGMHPAGTPYTWGERLTRRHAALRVARRHGGAGGRADRRRRGAVPGARLPPQGDRATTRGRGTLAQPQASPHS